MVGSTPIMLDASPIMVGKTPIIMSLHTLL
jgi:hypothetical protein